MTKAERLARQCEDAYSVDERPMDKEIAAELRRLSAELEALKKAIGDPVAWMHDDGRVVTATTMNIALRDGGAMASSLAGYTQPLYTLKGIK